MRRRSPARRAGLLTLAAGAVLLLSGCLDYREILRLNRDGSGTLQIDFVVDLGILGDIYRALGKEPTPQDMAGPSREEVLAGLEVEGIEIKALEIEEKGTKSKVHALIAFRDLAALAKIEGFGQDRRIDFYDEGDGRVRVVYGFDTDEAIPIEEVTDGGPGPGEPLDPTEKKILALTERASAGLAYRARLVMPGPVVKSNGKRVPDSPNESMWVIDKTHPEAHAVLGKGRISLMLLVERATLPFVKELKPLPARPPADADAGDRPPAPLGGLGDD